VGVEEAAFPIRLTQLDLRIFDADCAPGLLPPFTPPPGFPLKWGECCGYAFQLYVQDKTWSDGFAGGFSPRPDAALGCMYLQRPVARIRE